MMLCAVEIRRLNASSCGGRLRYGPRRHLKGWLVQKLTDSFRLGEKRGYFSFERLITLTRLSQEGRPLPGLPLLRENV
jgi:hypothetical protein